MHGLYVIDLYKTASLETNFMFLYNGNQVHDITYSNIWGCKGTTICYGQCQTGYFATSSTCLSCSSHISDCLTCISASVCTLCRSGLILSPDHSSCMCPYRYYLNQTSTLC